MKKHFLDKDNEQYKKQLADFMQSINPKPTLEEIEELRKRYLERVTKRDK